MTLNITSMKPSSILGLIALATASFAAGALLTGGPDTGSAPASHAETLASPAGDDHDEAGAITMSAAERTANGIETARVGRRALSEDITVPGEVTLDLYNSAQITPRISAQIVARHARLGDRVTAGQPLVTLTSVEMARAQGALIVAQREWQRVRKLGRDVVSDQRFIEARVAAEQARARVLAFGMTPEQVASLLKGGPAEADGTFALLAPRDGTVVRDNFIVGEVVEPGRVLFHISDETGVWVEAQLTPDQAAGIAVGAPAQVRTDDGQIVPGRVIQAHHMLDETTRTLPIRVAIDNRDDVLHPGQFVSVSIETGRTAPRLAVPETAVVLMDGAPTVFKAEGDTLQPTPVEVGRQQGLWIEIAGGLSDGDEIAVSQVFLLKSLIQKTRMGEGHGH